MSSDTQSSCYHYTEAIRNKFRRTSNEVLIDAYNSKPDFQGDDEMSEILHRGLWPLLEWDASGNRLRWKAVNHPS